MPTADQHRGKAERNRQFLAAVPPDDYPDWAAVVAFYAAVHQVERLRAVLGHGHSVGHDDRLTYIQIEHPDVHSAYHLLQNVSMLARYLSNADFFGQFQPTDVRERILDGALPQVEAYVRGRIGG